MSQVRSSRTALNLLKSYLTYLEYAELAQLPLPGAHFAKLFGSLKASVIAVGSVAFERACPRNDNRSLSRFGLAHDDSKLAAAASMVTTTPYN